MNSLKDSLADGSKTVTMSAAQINFLERLRKRAQASLDMLMESVASEYLHSLAIDSFGMDPGKDFQFEYHPEKEFDNLTISERVVHKR